MITRKKEEEFLPSHGELMKMLVVVGMAGKRFIYQRTSRTFS